MVSRTTALIAAVSALTVLGPGGPGVAASSGGTVVSATVSSATSIDASGCVAGASGVTDFGAVLPDASYVTPSDCTITFGSSNDTASLRGYQADGLGSTLWRPATGPLDTAFDTDGIVETTFSDTDYALDVDLTSTGKPVVVGIANEAGDSEFAVARYLADGSLDASFSGDGRHTIQGGVGWDAAFGVAVHPDDRITLVGYVDSTQQFEIRRLTAAGAADATFDGDGISTIDIGTVEG